MKKMLFCINPRAGKGEIKAKVLEAIDSFIKSGYEVTVHVTQSQCELLRLLPVRAPEYDIVVCSGGDGTLHETVAGLMACIKRPILGYIPAGTVNDFASSLHIPKNIPEAVKIITDGTAFPCDVGCFNERYFTYIAAFGAFTQVAYETPQQSKNLLGRTAYIMEGIKSLPNLRYSHMRITCGEDFVEGDFLFGMISSATSVGGFKLADNESVAMDDGLFECLFVKNPTTLLEAQQIINAVLRHDYTSEYILAFRTQTLEIHADEDVPWTLDGEFGGSMKDAEIANCKQALTVLIPTPTLI